MRGNDREVKVAALMDRQTERQRETDRLTDRETDR